MAVSGLIKSAGTALFLRAIGAALAFMLSVAISRRLGADGAGYYFLALSAVSIGAVISRLGLENTLLRFVAAAAEAEDWGRVRGILRLALLTAGLASLVVSAIIVFGAPLIAIWPFGTPGLAPALMMIGFSVFTFNIMTLFGEALKGLRRVRDSMLVSGMIAPAVALAALWPSTAAFGPAGAGLAFFLGTAAAALAGGVIWHHTLAGRPVATPFPRQEMWKSCRPLWVMTVINNGILPWAPLFLLGIWGGASDAGIFGAATRVSLLVSFFLLAVNTVLAPRFAGLHARGDIASIARLSRRFALFVTLAASPVFLTFIFAGDQIMRLFGPDFASSGLVLAILAGGQAVNAITGPAGVVLMMGGREQDMRTMSLVSVVVMLVLAFALIPQMGVAGAAITSAGGSITTSLIATAMVRARFGVWIVPFFTRNRR